MVELAIDAARGIVGSLGLSRISPCFLNAAADLAVQRPVKPMSPIAAGNMSQVLGLEGV